MCDVFVRSSYVDVAFFAVALTFRVHGLKSGIFVQRMNEEYGKNTE